MKEKIVKLLNLFPYFVKPHQNRKEVNLMFNQNNYILK